MWIPITLLAATLQILRTSRQHELRSVLSANAAGFVRYLYGAPFAIGVSVATFGVAGRPIPSIPARFWPIIAAAGMAQILATIALLQAFRMRNFALGTVYSKTEVIQVAIVERGGAPRTPAPARMGGCRRLHARRGVAGGQRLVALARAGRATRRR